MAEEENKDNNEAEENKTEGTDTSNNANGEENEEEQDGKKKKGSKLKLIIIAVVALLVLGGAGAAVFLLVLKKPDEAAPEIVKEEGEVIVNEDGTVEKSVYYDLSEFIINLNVGSKRPTFLKMTLSLELPGESQIARVEEKMPRIRDTFQVYLRELRQEDLQGSAGLYRLREELLLRINKIVYPGKVNDILFKEILVQ